VTETSQTIHASCVAFAGRGLLIRGPSGSGKSALALRLMGLGAKLVADDQTVLERRGDMVFARCPPALGGLIEARGIGVLKADPLAEAPLVLVADLTDITDKRLPDPRKCDVMGLPFDLVQGIAADHFAPALILYLSHGRHA
jgi:HPr kinase/phosphorylase